MILLDTHIWVWYVNASTDLDAPDRALIESSRHAGIGVSIISCWEVAKLVELQRIELSVPTLQWIEQALAVDGVLPLPITPEIIVDSTTLPGDFHRDPADQLIVATSRVHNVPLLTKDGKILKYPHVTIASP